MKHTERPFRGAPIVTCCVYRLWFFSLTVRRSYGTVLIKPWVCCTSVASLVSLFIGVEKKTWPVTDFAIESFDNRHGFSHSLRSAP